VPDEAPGVVKITNLGRGPIASFHSSFRTGSTAKTAVL
jgi:hypothetical protein